MAHEYPSMYYSNFVTNSAPWGGLLQLANPVGGFSDPFLGVGNGAPFPQTLPLPKNYTFPGFATYTSVGEDYSANLKSTYEEHWSATLQKQLNAAGNLDMQPYWLAPVRALGINIFQNAEFHGDGHPKDPGPIRLKELENYYYIARRNSDRDFLFLPGEQWSSDTYLGGAYEVLFNKPIYWTMKVSQAGTLLSRIPSMERSTARPTLRARERAISH